MASAGLIAVTAAAVVATAASWWGYARLEEPVGGRTAPAVLRGVGLFLILAGWWLPSLPVGTGDSGTVALLVDRSLSMTLPASAGGMSRADSAALVAASLDPSRTFWFGDSVRMPDAARDGVDPADRTSRIVPGLEAARAAGADSVVVLTDGELDDREQARATARRLGLAIGEVRVAREVGRMAIRSVDAPRTVEAGDTLRIVVEVTTVGEAPPGDSAGLSVTGPEGDRSIVRFEAPDPGRSTRLPVVMEPPAESGETWRPYDVRLGADADPIGPRPGHRIWVEVVPSAVGAVVVSADPDWEPHYLVPVLERSVAGGARAWIRVGPNRWVRSGTDRLPTADDARVRRDAGAAELLVVQGSADGIPGWLADVAARHSRVLWLARGPGTVPGSSIRVGRPLPGEWYAGGAPLPGPIAGYLDGLDHPSIPPVGRLFTLEGHDWAPVELRRNRAGEGRPPIGGDRAGERRRVVVAAEGLWRWASRPGGSRRAYRSLYAGLAGWLLEAPGRRPLELERSRLAAGDSIRWRVAPGVDALVLALRDSASDLVWADTLSAPDSTVAGPAVDDGSYRYEASGSVGDEPFEVDGPLEVEGAERELGARRVGAALLGATIGAGGAPPGGGRPVWPFVLAAFILSGEWILRRRLGLR